MRRKSHSESGDVDLVIMLIGTAIILFSLGSGTQQISDYLTMKMSLIGTLIMFIYGGSTLIGGLQRGEASYLGYFVEISSLIGILLVIIGPLLAIVEESLWITIAASSLVFISIPSTIGARLTRKR